MQKSLSDTGHTTMLAVSEEGGHAEEHSKRFRKENHYE